MEQLAAALADPRTLPALLALVSAIAALIRAETARRDAANALARLGGRRKGDAKSLPPPPPGVGRRSTD